LYGTTEDFLHHFGLRDIKDLPPADQLVDPKDVEEEHRDLFAKWTNA
jgi:chromosome segregation and condensation protein ScpB